MSGTKALARLGFALAAIVQFAVPAQAQRDASTPARDSGSVLAGVVVDGTNSGPLSGADVWIISADLHTQTDGAGAFRFSAIQPGKQLVEVRRLGFTALRDTITVVAGRETAKRLQCRGGFALIDPPGSKSTSTCRKTGAPDCYVTIRLDGVVYFTAAMAELSAPPPDLTKMFNVSDLAGVEFYAGDGIAPSGMHTNDQGCGTLWLWTREK